MATMIDTLEFSKSFQQAGFDQPKADALAGAFARSQSISHDELVTKVYLDARLAELKLDTERTIRNYMIGGQIGLVVALIALSHFTKVFG